MPRKGPAYPISPQWRERVLLQLEHLGISQNELARRAKISKAAMSEAMKNSAIQTTVMPEIHKALGWPPPPFDLSPDNLEALAMYGALDERGKGAMMERLRFEAEQARIRGLKKS
jgi:transcriptional regulator with XRE-family HTH domain